RSLRRVSGKALVLWRGRGSAAREVRALREHQLEATAQLLVARVFQGGKRLRLVEELLPAHGAAAADLPGLADQGPASEQVALQHELHEAGGFAAVRALLQEEAHGGAILREKRRPPAARSVLRTGLRPPRARPGRRLPGPPAPGARCRARPRARSAAPRPAPSCPGASAPAAPPGPARAAAPPGAPGAPAGAPGRRPRPPAPAPAAPTGARPAPCPPPRPRRGSGRHSPAAPRWRGRTCGRSSAAPARRARAGRAPRS